jgi:DNA-binding NtrC family response regulator
LNYSWPGNLRELENVLERAFLFSGGPVITDVELPPVRGPTEGAADGEPDLKTLRQQALRQAETQVLVQALKRLRGNVSAVARCMDITPRAVHMRLKSLGIDPAAFRIGVSSSRH